MAEVAAEGINVDEACTDGGPRKKPIRDVPREVALFLGIGSSLAWLSSVVKLVESLDCVGVCLRAKTGLNQLSIVYCSRADTSLLEG
jgi:hypothetical protein